MKLQSVILCVSAFLFVISCESKSSKSTDDTPPGYPTGFSATVNNGSVEMAWTMPSDDNLAGVLVLRRQDVEPETAPTDGLQYYAGDIIGEAEVVFKGHPTSNTYIDTPPGPGLWCYRAYVFNSSYLYTGSSGRCVDLSEEDTIPPSFDGLTSAEAVDGHRIRLEWNPASDNVTPEENIVYDVYRSEESAGQDFNSPNHTSEPGETAFTVTGLSPLTTYYFVVRARDEAGNRDSNTVERSAATLEQTDFTPPQFEGLVSATAVSDTQIQLQWNPASDDVTPEENIEYLVFQSTTQGGQDFSSPPTLTTVPGETTATIGGLDPQTEFFFVVRARDEAGNTDANTVEKSAVTLAEPDNEPPVFNGVLSAATISSTTVELSWNAATDNVTPQSGIVYDIYYSLTSGGQNFSVPDVTTPAGVVSYQVTGLSPSTTYYFVVRARDAAGNRDVNLVERSATTQEADTTPPVIVSDNFDTGGALVSGTTFFTASVTFSEPVTGVNPTNVTINNAASLTDFTTSDNITFNFTASGLVDGTRYTVSFSSGIKDLSENPLAPTSREIYVAAHVLYVRPGGAGVQDGTSPANALPLVSQALVLAAESTDIYVQSGVYSDSFTLKEGVNIYGGYDASFTVRDPVNNESLISQSAFNTTVTASGPGLTRDTVIDGMAFSNSHNGGRAVLRILDGAGVTVRNSRLFLPEGGCYTQSVIDASSGSGNSLVLERSVIYGGGLAFSYCSKTSYAVFFSSPDSYMRLDGNTITGGPNMNTVLSYLYTINAIRASATVCEIVNNVIHGGGTGSPSSESTQGIHFNTNNAHQKLVIANNTISGGKGYYRYAIYILGSIAPTHDVRIGNNVIFTDSANTRSYAIYRSHTTGNFGNVENNMITSVGVYLYSGASYTTLSSMETYLTSTGATATFNKEVSNLEDLHFEDYESMDWRPTELSPMGLTHGGRDTSSEAWGSVLTDRLGNPRTLLYSIGAYEYD